MYWATALATELARISACCGLYQTTTTPSALMCRPRNCFLVRPSAARPFSTPTMPANFDAGTPTFAICDAFDNTAGSLRSRNRRARLMVFFPSPGATIVAAR